MLWFERFFVILRYICSNESILDISAANFGISFDICKLYPIFFYIRRHYLGHRLSYCLSRPAPARRQYRGHSPQGRLFLLALQPNVRIIGNKRRGEAWCKFPIHSPTECKQRGKQPFGRALRPYRRPAHTPVGLRADDTALPSDSAVEAARARVGVDQCYVDSTGTLHRKHPDTQFDFSSVAKGYGIDLVADMLRRNGCSDFMIEIGGEISVQGLNRQGRPWRIQVDSPAGGLGHERLRVVQLGPQPVAMATSGNYRNFRPDGHGGVYGHTISPLTGRPVQGHVLSATVIAPDCTLADAIATACMAVADPDSALAIADRAAVSALIVYSSADTLATVQNSTFPIQH